MTNRSILSVPSGWGGQDRRWAESLKENLDIILGNRGHALDKAVTFRDLVDTGVVQVAKGVSWDGNATQLVPVSNEFADLSIPPAPTSLSASGAFQNIILTWDLQFYKGHSFVEVFRHTSDSISDATLVAQVSGYTGIYADAVGGNNTYYYWVRAVNQNDIRGPFNASAGVSGTTQPDITFLLTQLSGQITSSELATSLSTPIASISTIDALASALETYTGYISTYSGSNLVTRIGGLDTSVSSINSSITSINSSITSLNTATSNLQTSVSDLSANTADVYIQDTAPTGTIADNSRWYDTSDNNELHIYFDGDGDGDKEWVGVADPRIESNETAVADLETEVFNTDGTSRLATAAALSTLNTTVVNQGTSITSLTTDVTSLENEVFAEDGSSLLATASALSTTNTTVTTQGTNITSLQTDVTALEGEVFNEDGTVKLATSSALSDLTSTVNTQGNSITTAQGDITSLEGEVFNEDGTAKLALASTVSTLSSTVTTNGSDISTLQGEVTALEAQVFDSEGNLALATGSALTTLSNTVDSNGTAITSAQSDITSLNGAVFDSEGTVQLATTTAVSGLQTDIEAIYDGDNASIVKTIQTDVTALETEVFAADGSSLLATASALSGLNSTVTSQGSDISTLQTDVTALETEVFAEDGSSLLATASALSTLSSTVDSNGTDISSLQTDVTSLESEVFDSEGNGRLATGAALTSLTNDVTAIYDSSSNETVVGSIQSDITSLEGAVFDSEGAVKLASTTAVSALNTEVWGDGVTPDSATGSRIDGLVSDLTDVENDVSTVSGSVSTLTTEVFPNGTGSASAIDTLETAVFNADGTVKLATAAAVSALETEVYGAESAAASRIDGLFAEVFDTDGSSLLATASALETLNTSVSGEGGLASQVNSLNAAMFTDGDSAEGVRLATAAELETVETAVFPDGTSNASRISQLSSALWDTGSPTDADGNANDVLLASADAFSTVETAVFPNGTSSASSIDTLSVTVNGEDGNGGISASVETLTTVVGDENSGLSSQYSVKVDNNGHIAGFGLSNTDNDGTPTSAFLVAADKFAIVNPAAEDQQTNSPGNSSDLIIPFVVQTAATTLNGEDVPAGVYMDTAFIKSGSITSAFIGDAAIDSAKIGSVNADTIDAGTISTSRLNIDGATLTADADGALQVNELDANKITSGSISATVMDATTIYADNLEGDVNTIVPFRTTTSTSFRGPDGEVTLNEIDLTASTHDDGHKVFAVASGYLDSTSSKVYYIKMYIRSSPASSYTLVGECRVKSNTDLFVPFTVTGVLNTPTTSTARMKLTIRRYGSNGVTPDGFTGYDYVRERQGAVMGVR